MAKLKMILPGAIAALALTAALTSSRGIAQQASPPAQTATGDSTGQRSAESPRWWRQARDYEDDRRGFEDYAGDVVDDGPAATGPGPRARDDHEPRGERSARESGHSAAGMPHFGGPPCGRAGDRKVARMLDRLERVTQPTEAQRPLFEKLAEAAAKARDVARAGCPTERAVTPPGRLAAAEKRLDAMLNAVRTVRPAMDEYYASLNEEQKARLYIASARPAWRQRMEGWRDRMDGRRDRLEEGRDRPDHYRSDHWRDRMERPRDRLRNDDAERPRRDGFSDERGRGREGGRSRDRDEDRRGRGRESDEDRDGWPDSWRGRS